MKLFIFELEESLNQLQHAMEHFPKVNEMMMKILYPGFECWKKLV
jgi:hypothetical protein